MIKLIAVLCILLIFGLELYMFYLKNEQDVRIPQVAKIKAQIEKLDYENSLLKSQIDYYSSYHMIASEAAQRGFTQSSDFFLLY